ncbi:hypothetical protein C6P46_000160 [Rhodotorula mucilaginosa]|uniref:Allergen n=1 Tax=Rhodotorula mucilaginosa TaxID=5537 RepID=A0A9P6WAX1_RHOMI|nr:hypothetical protein C6P46_000160 [Rhodotorula mucilaginosa]
MNKIKQALSHGSDKETTHSSSTHSSKANDVVGPPTASSAGDRVNDAAVLGAKHEKTHDTLRDESVVPTTSSHPDRHDALRVKETAVPPADQHKHAKRDMILSEDDAKAATHDHQHLAPVVHERRHHHEVEEVERLREVDRHIHHVQHHVQPVLDTQHGAEQVQQKIVPQTHIKEQHVATDEDKHQFMSLNTVRDEVVEAPRERTIVDKGEVVQEHVHHVVHHVVQPVIERDTHEHHRIKTTIPVHHTVVEAPIVHASVQHEPLSLKDFVAGGGDLKSTLKHDPETLLNHGKCERTVEGPAETLTRELGLTSLNDKASTTSGATGSTSAAAPTSATGPASVTGHSNTTSHSNTTGHSNATRPTSDTAFSTA